jgi:hypothetical protein
MAVGWALARYAFEFSWNAPPSMPLAGPDAPRHFRPHRRARAGGGADADAATGLPTACRWSAPLPSN